MKFNINEYLNIFLVDSEEQLEILNTKLLDLEQHPGDTSLIDVLLRNAHSLKGSAGTFGFSGIAELTHEIENVFKRSKTRYSGRNSSDPII